MVADISKMDKQALLTTFAQALPVLTNFEACRDASNAAQDRLNYEQKGDKFSTWVKEDVTKRASQGLSEMMKTNPKEYFGGIACIAAGMLLFFALLQVNFLLALLPLVPGLVGGFFFFNRANKAQRINTQGSVVELGSNLETALTACEQSMALLSVPPAYRYSYALEQMAQLLQNMRANTWMECADKYETMMHQMRVEGLLEENNELQAISIFYQQQIAKNTRAAAIFSGLTFLNTL